MQKRASVSRDRCYIYSTTTTILAVCVSAKEGECLEMTLLNECLEKLSVESMIQRKEKSLRWRAIIQREKKRSFRWRAIIERKMQL